MKIRFTVFLPFLLDLSIVFSLRLEMFLKKDKNDPSEATTRWNLSSFEGLNNITFGRSLLPENVFLENKNKHHCNQLTNSFASFRI